MFFKITPLRPPHKCFVMNGRGSSVMRWRFQQRILFSCIDHFIDDHIDSQCKVMIAMRVAWIVRKGDTVHVLCSEGSIEKQERFGSADGTCNSKRCNTIARMLYFYVKLHVLYIFEELVRACCVRSGSWHRKVTFTKNTPNLWRKHGLNVFGVKDMWSNLV